MTERHLPDDSSIRSEYPLWDGLMAYFPAALLEVSRWSKVGGAKYNNDKLRWVREESTDHKNKIMRHLLDAEQKDEHGFYEAVALAWRSLALLQTILEDKEGRPTGENAKYEEEPTCIKYKDKHGQEWEVRGAPGTFFEMPAGATFL